MLPDLLSVLATEKLDKQFVTKLPYAFLISLGIFLPFHFTNEPYIDSAIISASVSIVAFFIVNTIFNSRIQWMINDNFFRGDLFHETKSIYSRVVDKSYSPIKNIDGSKACFLALGAISGALLTAFFVAAFLLIFDKLEIEIQVLLAVGAIASFLVYYDLMKSPLDTDDENTEGKKEKNPLAYGVLEKFLLTNSLKAVPRFRVPLWRIIIRLCGPVLRIKAPKVGYEELIVYGGKELQNRLCEFSDEKRDAEIILQHMKGLKASELVLEENQNRSERIHLLAQRKPTENFPYLYGLDQNTDRKVWGLFRIIDSKSRNKPIGQLYIHIFKGLLVKHRLRQVKESGRQKTPDRKLKIDPKGESIEREFEEDIVFLFILIGEQTFIKYLATELRLAAKEFPRDLMSIEWDQK